MVIIASPFNRAEILERLWNVWNLPWRFQLLCYTIFAFSLPMERICRFPPNFKLPYCRFPLNVCIISVANSHISRNLSINSTHNIKDSLPHIIQHTIYYLSVYWILLCGSILVGIKALFSDLSIFEYNSISINKHFFRFLLP